MLAQLRVFRCRSRLTQMAIQTISHINQNNNLEGGERSISGPSPPSYSSVDDLEATICDYLAQHNEKPKPFRWTKRAEDILASERRALNALDEIRGNR